MSESDMSLQNTFTAARNAGMVVKFPKSNELFLDLDTRDDFIHFQKMIGLLPGINTWVRSESKSGYPKSHVIVTLDRDVTTMERILLQACLGSDRKHELLSYLAARSGNPQPSVFFERR